MHFSYLGAQEARRNEARDHQFPRAGTLTMTTFDKREEGFEKKFALDEEQKFKAQARRNRLLKKCPPSRRSRGQGRSPAATGFWGYGRRKSSEKAAMTRLPMPKK